MLPTLRNPMSGCCGRGRVPTPPKLAQPLPALSERKERCHYPWRQTGATDRGIGQEAGDTGGGKYALVEGRVL